MPVVVLEFFSCRRILFPSWKIDLIDYRGNLWVMGQRRAGHFVQQYHLISFTKWHREDVRWRWWPSVIPEERDVGGAAWRFSGHGGKTFQKQKRTIWKCKRKWISWEWTGLFFTDSHPVTLRNSIIAPPTAWRGKEAKHCPLKGTWLPRTQNFLVLVFLIFWFFSQESYWNCSYFMLPFILSLLSLLISKFYVWKICSWHLKNMTFQRRQ